MISTGTIMRPLPVRPIDGWQTPGAPTPLPIPASGRMMQPLVLRAAISDAQAALHISPMRGVPPHITPTF